MRDGVNALENALFAELSARVTPWAVVFAPLMAWLMHGGKRW